MYVSKLTIMCVAVTCATCVTPASAQSGSRGGGGGGGQSSGAGSGSGSSRGGGGSGGVVPSGLQAAFAYSLYEAGRETKTYDGTITMVKPNQLFWDYDGRTGPIPYGRDTRLVVTAPADRDLLKTGRIVSVTGKLNPDRVITNASVEVHTRPKQTVNARQIVVDPIDRKIQVSGRIVREHPLTIKAIDSISPGYAARPIRGLVLTVDLPESDPGKVTVNLSNAPGYISEGDAATVLVRQDMPNIAMAVIVKRSEPVPATR